MTSPSSGSWDRWPTCLSQPYKGCNRRVRTEPRPPASSDNMWVRSYSTNEEREHKQWQDMEATDTRVDRSVHFSSTTTTMKPNKPTNQTPSKQTNPASLNAKLPRSLGSLYLTNAHYRPTNQPMNQPTKSTNQETKSQRTNDTTKQSTNQQSTTTAHSSALFRCIKRNAKK